MGFALWNGRIHVFLHFCVSGHVDFFACASLSSSSFFKRIADGSGLVAAGMAVVDMFLLRTAQMLIYPRAEQNGRVERRGW